MVFKVGFSVFLSWPFQIYLSLVLKAKCFEDGRPPLCCSCAELMHPSLTCCGSAKIAQTAFGVRAGGLVVYSLAIKRKHITGA